MLCFTCNKDFKLRPGTTKYLRPIKLKGKLQDRKCDSDTLKPDLTIIEALGDITDWDVTLETLKKYDEYYVCHECQVNLRQAVNKRAEVEDNIEQLNEKMSQVSNSQRREYYKDNYCKDKIGRCWGCMITFVPTNNKNKWSDRVHLGLPVVEGMSVYEAIISFLEEQAVTLKGLYARKVYICKKCLLLLRNVIKSQCVFDTLQTIFKSQTVEDSVFTQLLNGKEVPVIENRSNDFLVVDGINEGSSGDNEGNSNSLNVKTLSDVHHTRPKTNIKRPYYTALDNMLEKRKPNKHSKTRKFSQKSVEEDGNHDKELNVDKEENDIVNLESRIVTDTEDNRGIDNDTNDVVNLQDENLTDIDVNKTLDLEGNESVSNLDIDENEEEELKGEERTGLGEIVAANMKSGDMMNAGIQSVGKVPADKCEKSENLNKPVENLMEDSKKDEKKKQIQVKVKLQGTQMKALSKLGCNVEKAENYKADSELEERTMAEDWVIYYYPKFSGRSEFIRLIFEETGTPYKECGETFAGIREKIIDGKLEGYPHFAPPMIKKGNFQLSQTSVICRYLGEELGIYPDSVEDKLHAEQINVCCHDYIAEGRLAFHGIYPVGSYSIQKEETQPYIDRFVAERFPRWMKYFERVLATNNGGKGFLFGEELTYCDLSLFHILHATEAQFPDSYKTADYMPLLKSFKERIASRPRIAAYLKSDRWRGFSGDSMM